MSAQNGSATMKENVQPAAEGKGKGKAAEAVEDTGMDVDDSSEDDEVDDNEPVVDEEDEDNMEEISAENIISSGRRTRGKNIDFAKAAAEMPEEDEDEDEDDDFEEPEEDEEMKH